MKNIILSVVILSVAVGGFYLLSKIPKEDAIEGINLDGARVESDDNSSAQNAPAANLEKQPNFEVGDELKAEILKEGTGVEAKNGDKVSVHYIGVLEDGTKFDSSLDRGQPFAFTLGAGQVIRGWDLGVIGMKIGEARRLYIPSEFGYGERGAGNSIPPNANLVFEVELLGIE
ncbi:MAG: FKBP-type peptidyl-prolyl cis-trans isomerase [Patescibacteria group bacterium]|nr:FKBP-type peptidyl-prolyl cis-trans isomerase [Patescibacteria group bacterium]